MNKRRIAELPRTLDALFIAIITGIGFAIGVQIINKLKEKSHERR